MQYRGWAFFLNARRLGGKSSGSVREERWEMSAEW